jgi:PhnB protein
MLANMNQIHEVFTYISVRNATAAIDYYQRAFGATEIMRLVEPGTERIGHAEIRIGQTVVMLADEFPETGIVGPETLGETPFVFHLHVDNADEIFARAIEAGGTVVREMKDQFYGERSGRIRDPFGHEWMLGHEIEKVSAEEMQNRYNKLFA